ncbi:MAG: serine/threonine protein kinase [Planctomycetes bacterium]|nr:serine/threonine protein kinase [Planctomycetota bacterium]
MTGDRDEALGRLTEELAAAIAAGDSIVLAAWAQRFGVEQADVQACLRALRLLDDGLGEEPDEGPVELPPPTLPADYELLGELGRGGMGVVYRARQRSSDREVAVKVLRPADLVFGDALRRFRSEARSLARLRHRHIVSVHDCGETPEGLLWFAMDLVDGRTLADELRSSRRFLPARAVKVIRQVASAVAHAHAQGIVHRDLKPQNVLIDAHGDAFVVDFGLARDAAAAGTRTMTGELLGTPAYMSPEQASGDGARIGEACDVWALGALLYEMLAGRGPFRGMPLHETIRAILEEDPPRPRSLDGNVPAELEAVCLKALHKRPEQRYPTALAFAEDLERFADGRGVLARSPGRVVRGMRWLRRRSKPVVAVIAAVLVTVAAVLLWLPSLRRDVVIGEAERLVQAGHAAAAIESLRTVLAETTAGSEQREAAELVAARAHNDVAIQQLSSGSDPQAAASEASRLVGFHTPGGVIDMSEKPSFTAWAWEMVRARAMYQHPLAPLHRGFRDLDRLPLTIPALAPLVRVALDDALTPRAVSAAWIAARFGVPLEELDEAKRLSLLEPLVRMAGFALEAGWQDVGRAFPCRWRGADVDAWWSPAVELRLADLATDDALPAAARAVAFRAFCQLVALPAFALPATDSPDAQQPDFAGIANAANNTVKAWWQWASQPLEQQLRARIDLLVAARTPGAELLPGCDDAIATMLRGSTAAPDAAPDVQAAWWARQRQRPYAEVLGEALGVAPGQAVDLVTALDRSAAANEPTAMAWRELAWLQLPAGTAVPRCTPATTDSGASWRTSCLAAAGRDDPRRFVVRIGLVSFADAEATPVLLDGAAWTVRLDDPVEVRMQIPFAAVPVLTRRRVFEDEWQRAPSRWLGRDLTPIQVPAPIGSCVANFDARLVLDDHGVQLRGAGMLLTSLPQGTYQTTHEQVSDRVLLHTAACFCSRTFGWNDGEHHATLQLLVALDELDGAPRDVRAFGIDDWRAAATRRFRAEAASPDAAAGPVDWALPAWWPMPEAAEALQQLARRGKPSRLSKAALQMAGCAQGPGQWPVSSYREPPALLPTHIVAATGSPEVRRELLDDLSALAPTAFTAAIADTLRRAAESRAFPLPAELTRTLAAVPDDGWSTWVWSGLWGVFFVVLLAGLLRATGRPEDRAWALTWLTIFTLVYGVEWRVQLGGVVLTPTFVVIAVTTALAVVAHRSWPWYRLLGLLLMLVAVAWFALAWFGLTEPRDPIAALAGVAFLTCAPWAAPHRRRPWLRRGAAPPRATGA